MHAPIARIVEMVGAEVVRDPDATTQELFDLAVLLDEGISDLRVEEFAKIYEQPARGGAPTRRRRAKTSRKTPRKPRSRPAPSAPSPAPSVDRRGHRDDAGNRDEAGRRHEAVRRELERFAVDLSSAAGDTKRLLSVIADLDRYVARMLKAAGS